MRPVGEPNVTDISMEKDAPELQYKATVEVIPPFELGEYKGLAVTVTRRPVTEEAMEAQIRLLRQRAAHFHEVDRPAQAGDYVQFDIEAFEEGEPVPGTKGENQAMLLGEDENEKALEDALIGMPLGGEKEDYRGFLGHIALFELYMLRRYAAKIDYEFALHGGPELQGKEALYAGKLAGATQVAYPPESYLDDVDPFFYCANYLRAWMLQAQLREVLKTRFGRRWWQSEGSGAFLKELWKEGQAQDADALSRRLGFGSLGAEGAGGQGT